MSKKSSDGNPSFLVEKDAYTVNEFCLRHGLSRAAFYKLEPLGQAPRIMQSRRKSRDDLKRGRGRLAARARGRAG